MTGTKLLCSLITSLLLLSCTMSGDPAGWADGGFSLINSPCHSANRLDILYNKNFSGTVSYIVSPTDLRITGRTEFNNSSATKQTVLVTPEAESFEGMELTPMLNYIAIPSLSAGTKYYVYILDTDTGDLTALTRSTMAKGTTVQTAGAISVDSYDRNNDGVTENTIEYNINFPDGYDSGSSEKWPFVLSVKAPNFTAADPDLPCITFNINISWFNNDQFLGDVEALKAEVKLVINSSAYRIDRSRIYGCGFSAGGGAVMYIANNCGSDGYEMAGLVLNGVSGWAGSSSLYTGNLGKTNIWISGGENDTSAEPWICFKNMPKTAGDHFLSLFAETGHSSSLTWDSPYTFLWLLDK